MIEMNKKNKARIKKIVGALSGAAAGQIIPEIKEELKLYCKKHNIINAMNRVWFKNEQ